MISFFHMEGYGQVELAKDGKVRCKVVGDDSLLQTLQELFSKGVPSLQEFRHKGIPGKLITYRKITDEDDLVTILQFVQRQTPHFAITIDQEKEDEEPQLRYTLLKWNGEYGADAIFIVRDNWKARQSLFTPGRCEDLFWFLADLANDPSVSHWEEFGEESFDDLEPIAF
ncbi:hypothetical protein P4U99_25965 [Brevibacillus agri]|uniref:hypothetical protein n=1 Tax=Brevibacillus TaxID=55080 RepID=UPI001D0B6A2D|nr:MULTISPECIES: hypothetical protein [Brevibacillus]MCC0566241.1 hypothetical protein [Brevibacillus borstelensis]MCG5252439.1 hypothetical protein [Brevibacillus agri]MED1646566.1 hypothetical protein [Brevibacillus agri]MED1655180.1 hypothetical protein [Brevibacillus agri]MED1690211.1 hypothetical protein [Brevibacillus agri]